MQLTIEVLPAPFGPMIENSSPSLTPKLTSVSARTPPKRSDTPRTSKAQATHFLQEKALGALFVSFATAVAILYRPSRVGHPTKEASTPEMPTCTPTSCAITPHPVFPWPTVRVTAMA